MASKNKAKMNLDKNPAWWNCEHEVAWNRARHAMKRDWNRIKQHLNGNEPDDSEAIIAPSQPNFEELEPAYRFGYGARLKFGAEFPEWDDQLEMRLAEHWRVLDPTRKEKWEQDRLAIRFGWDYDHEKSEHLQEVAVK